MGDLKVIRPDVARESVPGVRWGMHEVADCLGVSASNLQYIRDLPAPVQQLKRGMLWLASDIKEFEKVYSKRKRRRQTVAA